MAAIPFTGDNVQVNEEDFVDPEPVPVKPPSPKGRGSGENPPNRFAAYSFEPDAAEHDPLEPEPKTEFFLDQSRSIISHNQSPDVPFDASINVYRGCEHGCSYCYARPYHEYLGFSLGLDFETKILIKEDAPELLRRALASKTWKPQVLGISGVTDPYQPVERRLGITRRCLQVLAEFRNPVAVITKNRLIVRDRDILADLATHQAASAMLSIPTLDPELAAKMEPRASTPAQRLKAIQELRSAGIPAGVMIAPVIPGMSEHEIPRILKAAAEAGAVQAGYTVLRLSPGVEEVFVSWLQEHFPGHEGKVLRKLEKLRDGKRHDSDFRYRMLGRGIHAQQIHALFQIGCTQTGLDKRPAPLSIRAFRRPQAGGPWLPGFEI
ncbi:MAG: radical SAM protein [Planctomycetota bacterium]|nr:MAG: radical SAM protein [Planctomycetota bacterium]